MKKHMVILPVFLVVVVAFIVGVAATDLSAWYWPDPIKFEEAEFFAEINFKDKDIGLQAFLGGEAWKRVKIIAPNGKLLYVRALGEFEELGLTEFRFETDEPTFAVVDSEEADTSIPEFLEDYPEGWYKFFGCTVEGEFIWKKAWFSHDNPCAPVVTLSRVYRGTTIRINWTAVTHKLDNETGECGEGEEFEIGIFGYQAIVECEEEAEDDEDGNVFEFVVDLGDGATQATVTPEFFEGFTGTCKAEVLAIGELENGAIEGKKGNRTITETDEFCVDDGEFVLCEEDED